MANRFLSNININDEYTLPSADGTADQIITTDGAGQLSFVDQSTLNSGSASRTEILVKNLEGSALSKGDPVYIIGSVGASERLQVGLADAGDVDKMPCVGLLTQDLAINGEGTAIVTGKLKNLITSPIDGATPTENDTIYVKSGGGLTLTKPTGSTNLIQNVGQVGRVSTSSDGNIVVSAILRSNDVPNLTTGKIWVGTANNTAESTVVHLDETNERMGIGTTSPETQLQIGEGTGTQRILLYGANSLSTSSEIILADSSSGPAVYRYGAGIRFNSSNNILSFRSFFNGNDTADNSLIDLYRNTSTVTTPIRINFDTSFSGNVGIGTTSPSHKLDVDGSAQFNTNTGSTPFYITRLGSTGEALSIKVMDDNVRFESIQDEAADSYGGFDFRMDGGTTEPNFVVRKNTGNPILHVDGGGDVGIGTTSPNYKLTVGGSSTNSIQLLSSSTGTGAFDGLRIWNTGSSVALWNYDNTPTLFGTSGSERMRIDSSGNVGIGTTSPSSKLEIRATNATHQLVSINRPNSDTAALYIGNDSASPANGVISSNNSDLIFGKDQSNTLTEHMRINTSGNVGIGTSSPSQKLHVAGNIRVTGFYYDSNNSAGMPGQVLSATSGGTDWITLNDTYYTESESDSRFVNVTGDTMTGNLAMGGNLVSDAVIGFKNMGSTQGPSPNYNYKYFRITNDLTFDRNRIYELLIDADDNGGYSGIYHIYISQHNNSGNHDRVRFHYVSGDKDRAELLVATDEHVWVRSTAKWGNVLIRAIHENEDISSMPFATTETRPATQAASSSDFVWNGDNNTFTDQEQWHAGNDGSGSGLDADLLDGQHASAFALTSHHHDNLYYRESEADARFVNVTGDTMTGDLSFGSQVGTWISSAAMSDAIGWNSSYGVYIGSDIGGTHYLRGNGTFTTGGSTYDLWHSGNDGPGSGLDADTLDGIQGASFLRSDANDTATGYITFSNSDGIVLDGNGSTPDSTTATYNQGLTIEGGNMRLNIDVSNVSNGGAYIQTRHESTTYPNSYYTLALNPLGGNVGIGTTSPTRKLHVVGGSTYAALLDSNQDYTLGLARSGTEEWWLKTYTDGRFAIHENGVGDKVTIKAGGNVGIGTTSPNAKLDVSGDFGIQGILFTNTGYQSTTGAGVNNGFAIAYRTGVTTLNNAYNYIVRLTTAGTGTDSGSYWIIGYDNSTSSWGVRMVAQSGNTSNHPLLAIGSGGDTMVAYTNHVSGYPIRWSCESIGISDNDGTLHNMGSDYHWQRDVNKLFYNDGNVGIGTNSPSGRLTIGSGVTTDNSTMFNVNGQYNDVGFNGGTSGLLTQGVWSFINSGTWDQTRFYVQDQNNSNSRLTFDFKGNGGNTNILAGTSSGNVGIGTTSPNAKLHVYNTGNGEIEVERASGALVNIQAQSAKGLIGTDSNHTFSLKTNSSERLTILNSGNVGIGTTNAGYKLDVAGDLRVDNGNVGSTSGDEVEHVKIQGARHFVKFKEVRTANDSEWKNTTFKIQAGVDSTNHQSIDFVADGSYQEHVDIRTGNQVFNTRFTSSGNVGIGTTSPGEKLHVYNGTSYVTPISYAANQSAYALKVGAYNNTSFDMGLQLKSTSGGSPYMSFKTNSVDDVITMWGGSVGIGNIGLPSYTLDVNGSIASSVTSGFPELRLSDAVSDFLLTTNSGGDGIIKTEGTSKNIRFFNNSGETMRISGGGNVGIGTTSPDSKLHVKEGDITIEGYNTSRYLRFIEPDGSFQGGYVNYDGGSNILKIGVHNTNDTNTANDTDAISILRSNGNVGIGTSPSYKLDVDGAARFGDNQGILLTDDSGTSYVRALNNHLNLRTTRDADDIYFSTGTTTTTKMFIQGDTGNVGIGTTNPSPISSNLTTLDIQGSTGGGLRFGTTAGVESTFYTLSNGAYAGPISSIPLYLITANTVRATISSSGNFGIGTTSPTSRFHVKQILASPSVPMVYFEADRGPSAYGAVNVRVDNLDYGTGMRFYKSGTYDSSAIGFMNGSTSVGSISIGTSSTSYNTTSDYRLKENVASITDGITRLKQLQPKRFNFIGDTSVVDGFIAHEAKQVVPEAVTGEKDEVLPNGDPVYQGIDQAKLVPLLTAALQDAITKIEELETRIQTLENQ